MRRGHINNLLRHIGLNIFIAKLYRERKKERKNDSAARWRSVGVGRDTSHQELAHVGVVLGQQLLLHVPELHLQLLVAHGVHRKCSDFVQEV